MEAAAQTVSSTIDAGQALTLLKAAAENYGREIKVFVSRAANLAEPAQKHVAEEEESDDFYDFTEQDYYQMLGNRKTETFLKTKKIRDAEAAARRARITKAIIRVQFPDNYILEAKFQPSDTLSSLVEFLKKVISRPDIPFYLYTTPPKQRLQDPHKDFYMAGLAPGGLVYFSYDIPKGFPEEELPGILATPYLRSDVMALEDLHLLSAPPAIDTQGMEHTSVSTQDAVAEHANPRPRKSGAKPKWMKL